MNFGVGGKVLLLSLAVAACHRKPARQPPPPPAAPFAFAQTTPDAKVSLTIGHGVRFQPDLHLKLFNDSKRELTEFIAQAATDRPRALAKGAPDALYTKTIAWKVTLITNRLVSARDDWTSYTGGAHPEHGTVPLIWDQSMQRVILPSELMRPDADYARLDAILCDAAKAEKARRMGPEEAEKTVCPQWKDSRPLLVRSTIVGKAGGIDFPFDPYVLGAYAEGDYDVVIPQALVRDALNPAYLPTFDGRPDPLWRQPIRPRPPAPRPSKP